MERRQAMFLGFGLASAALGLFLVNYFAPAW
jgi:hypothetical protein